MPEKPEVKRKTVITVRWCDIFIFSNTPYPDKKKTWALHTQNNALNLILNSDFHFTQQKMKKIGIFFHSLLFLTLEFGLFRALSVTRAFWNSSDAIAPTFSYVLQKSLGWYL